VDIFTAEKRSEIMSLIRSRNTKPERMLYEVARRVLGPRRRIHRNCNRLLGTPDLYIPALSLVVFLDGCFFHGCPIHGHIPYSHSDFWERKITRNKRRDRRYERKLRQDGFSVWRFWEHDLRKSRLHRTIRRFELAVQRQLN
jgi:DNA mismatch endonuclease, patch repair protein